MNKIFSLFVLFPTISFAQTITYTWPGPLGQAVIYPKWTDSQFMGTRADWQGASSVSGEGPEVLDLRTVGWSCEPGKAYLMMNVLAFEPMLLDSITITHEHGPHGPKHLRVTMSTSCSAQEHVISDTDIDKNYSATRISLRGLMRPIGEAEYGYVQLKLIPYDGAEGTWDIRSVVIHASRPRPKAIDRSPTIADVLDSLLPPEPPTTGNVSRK